MHQRRPAEVERAGRGKTRPDRTQEEGQCPPGSREGGKRRNENKNTGRRMSPSTKSLGGSWSRKMVPVILSFRGPLPPVLLLPLQWCWGCAAAGLCFFPGVCLAHQSLWLLLQVEIKAGEGAGPWGQGAAVKVPCVCARVRARMCVRVCGGGGSV